MAAKIDTKQVYEVRRLYEEGATARELAERYGVTTTTIYSILRGDRGGHKLTPPKGHNCRKLSDDQVRQLRFLARRGASQSQLAKAFPVAQSSISLILSGKTYRWLDDDAEAAE